MSGLRLYSMPSSGNSYKVRLLLSFLGLEHTHIACENGSAALAEAKASGNAPMGKLPALHLPDGNILSESNAILCYLAQGSGWLPENSLQQAQMLAWMFFEQNRHEPVIAVRASLRTYPERAHLATPARMEELLESGHVVLALMEEHLSSNEWFAGTQASVADIALYAYTHTAGSRGGYDMARFPALNDRLPRIAAMPGYVPLEAVP